MSLKHTPGPWETKNGHDVFSRLGAANASGERCEDNDGWHIADCQMDDRLAWPEQRANTLLVAAAPLMLEALKDAVAALEVCGKDFPAMEKAREAIAKATGSAA